MYHPSLDYFCAIVENRQITRAAEELNVSQQSLSSYLIRLENHYSMALFERKPRFKPTPFGEQLYEAALNIRAVHMNIDVICRNYKRQVTLRIGCIRAYKNIVNHVLPLIPYQEEYPESKTQIVVGRSGDCLRMLEEGAVDFCLINNRYALPPLPSIEIGDAVKYVVFSRKLIERYFPDSWMEKLERWRALGLNYKELAELPLIEDNLVGRKKESLADSYARENGYSIMRISESSSASMNREMCVRGVGYYMGYYHELTHFKKDTDLIMCLVKDVFHGATVSLYSPAAVSAPHLRFFWEQSKKTIQRLRETTPRHEALLLR